MSVPKHKRNESKLEVLTHSIRMRRAICAMLLKDFGIKERVFDNKSIIEKYPEWLITHFRTNIINILFDINKQIIRANTIFVKSESEFNDRRKAQTDAICGCESLLQEFQFVISILDMNVDINKYAKYVEMIERETALLRAWRKSDNKLKDKVCSVANSSNFSNVNEDGNCNNNNASNANGVRPISKSSDETTV